MPELSREQERRRELERARGQEQPAERARALLPFGAAVVSGPSMVPTLRHGDRLVVRYGARIRPGDVVVLRHPFQQDLLVVKRAAQRRDGGWWVLGDNPGAGGDSTDYGTVPEELVLGRVRWRYRPRGEGHLSPLARVRWALTAARPVLSDRSASSRFRAR
ncbi:nickel-type superoxide dismutase maturation protease [Streptomyces sp. NPDC087212]|uniref:nickel-type superoxide dismutase maturation protease n=1 Tax=Streptomyces sp. NPDC087212 TaxID=3365766 RepID=UPI003817C51A